MKIVFLILGSGEIVRDINILKAMARRGFFKFPVDDTNNPYVDEGENSSQFEYKKEGYSIKYFPGCFWPFVVKN